MCEDIITVLQYISVEEFHKYQQIECLNVDIIENKNDVIERESTECCYNTLEGADRVG